MVKQPSPIALITAERFVERTVQCRKLRTEVDLFKELLDLTPCPTVMTDANGGVVYGNKSYLGLLGVELEDVSGDKWAEAIAPEDRARTIKKWKDVLSEQRHEAEDCAVFLTPNGPVRMHWKAARLSNGDYAAVIFHPGCAFHLDSAFNCKGPTCS